MSCLFRFAKSNLLVIPALWRPNVKAAKDKEGLLKVNRIRSVTGVGIKRKKNAKIFIKNLEVLLLKIPRTTGGNLIAIPVDKRLKIIVCNISFKKSNNPKCELDLNRELTELKFSKLLLKIKYRKYEKENKIVMKKNAIKIIDRILFVVSNFIFLNINPERIIKIAKDHK